MEIKIHVHISIFIIIMAVIAIILTAISVVKIVKLNAKFNGAIVLIPLFRNIFWLKICVVFFSFLLAIAITLMIVLNNYIFFSCIIVILLTNIIQFVAMALSKCAVLDSGILVPFRFIEWVNLAEYELTENEIFFCCDEKGFDILSSVTPRLKFSKANREKLVFLLEHYKL